MRRAFNIFCIFVFLLGIGFNIFHLVVDEKSILNYELVDGKAYVESTNIGDYGYYRGRIVRKIDIPEKIEINKQIYEVYGISEEAFASCRDLRIITMPNTIEYIGKSAFESCSKADIYLSNNIKTIEDHSFFSVGTISKLPNTLEYIGKNAFFGIDNKEITIPNSVTYIGKNAFWNITLFLNTSSIPDTWDEEFHYDCEIIFKEE